MQSFSLPGECDKAAKILKSFLGTWMSHRRAVYLFTNRSRPLEA